MTQLTERAAVDYLLSPLAVRERCYQIFELAKQNKLQHFSYHPEKLPAVTEYVAQEILSNYPDLDIPYHSRWQHFLVGGVDRVARINPMIPKDPMERGRALFDLVIVSVLLDAGAGNSWKYKEPTTEQTFARSEGLAVASFDMFVDGLFSADPKQPLRVDAKALQHLTTDMVARGMQVGATNPLTGLDGRTGLLQQLGQAIAAKPEFFGSERRLGKLFDYIVGQSTHGKIAAPKVLRAVLDALGSIWPGRQSLAGINLGDCWIHPQVKGEGPTQHLVPFHKLSQWLTYSLLEPLEEFGLQVTELNQLTGLPEYRNGGLLLDLGVLTWRDPAAAQTGHEPNEPLIVEWRALTVCLLDLIGQGVCQLWNKTTEDFPLAKVLQGGTWSAGRKIAKAHRPDGRPPITIISDGTVF